MLSPFPGFVPAGRGPFTSEEITARSRQIRDDAGRYQPGPVIEHAITGGLLETPGVPSLFRYEIAWEGITISGLVGVSRAADLVPHEGTLLDASDEPAPVLEIRPILALVERPLPRPATTGPAVEVIEPDGTLHSVEPVDHDGIDLGSPVVADGHHRRRAAIATRGPDARVLTLLVGESGRGLESGTFHRVFDRAGSLTSSASDTFDIEPIPSPETVPGSLVWVEGASGRSFVLTPSSGALAGLPEPLRASPAAVAQSLLYPMLGLHERDAVHAGTEEEALAGLVPSGGCLLLPPVEIPGVIAAARSGNLLPPKASRFRPKPLRGLVLRVVED